MHSLLDCIDTAQISALHHAASRVSQGQQNSASGASKAEGGKDKYRWGEAVQTHRGWGRSTTIRESQRPRGGQAHSCLKRGSRRQVFVRPTCPLSCLAPEARRTADSASHTKEAAAIPAPPSAISPRAPRQRVAKPDRPVVPLAGRQAREAGSPRVAEAGGWRIVQIAPAR